MRQPARCAPSASVTSAVYKVATNEYLFGGGDGYAALGRGQPLIDASAGTLMASMIIEAIARQGEIAPKTDGRITRLN